ncbi:hypothetical protein FOZ60_016400 [Perkinsus olseni]|uniref:Uncharacterized protein n=1 Tax=Perkinsus olseni TaxID=32597 RepID=A0A7J6N503_PEROL|nr:hypothetical protein FOZ60_016400 [Perkinsus olseni]
MNTTVNSDKKTIRIAFVCEHELHGFDQELDYKVRGAGSEATLDIYHGSRYYGPLILAFAQLCPKFGNGQPVFPDLTYFDVDGGSTIMTTVAGVGLALERRS